MEEMMKNYFAEEKFLGDREVLLAAATKAGVPDAERVVDDKTACLDTVQAELAK